MTKFLIGLLGDLADDPRVQAAIKKILGEIIAEKIVPLIPLAAGAAASALIEEIVDHTGEAIFKGAVPNVEQIADKARQALDAVVPFDLPFIGNLRDLWPH